MKEYLENKPKRIGIEESAHFEGNMSVLLFERLQNPVIKKRLVDMFVTYHEDFDDGYDYGMTEEEKVNAAPNPNWKKGDKTREEIEKEIEHTIEKIFSVTNINHAEDIENTSRGFGHHELISPKSVSHDNGQPFTTEQLSITEAHEKGHSIRSLSWSEEGTSVIQSGFDFSKIEVTETLRTLMRSKERFAHNTDEELDILVVDYYSDPDELVERMAQLKNYFGMKGDETFTKEHLDYAKEHYMEDTGLILQIKPFLDSVTPETEQKFLELINTLGI